MKNSEHNIPYQCAILKYNHLLEKQTRVHRMDALYYTRVNESTSHLPATHYPIC